MEDEGGGGQSEQIKNDPGETNTVTNPQENEIKSSKDMSDQENTLKVQDGTQRTTEFSTKESQTSESCLEPPVANDALAESKEVKVEETVENVDKNHEAEVKFVEKLKDVAKSEKSAAEGKYVAPCEDPLEKATKFLMKHDILELLQTITAGIAYKRPPQPLEYMIDEIEKIQEQDRRRKGIMTRKSSPSTSDKK